MRLFSYSSQERLVECLKKPFKYERDLQRIFEKNLYWLTGLEFIQSEFTVLNFRFDTLAFDRENKSFVIIEYKRSRHFSVIDQGVGYLNALLTYKAEFIVAYNERKKERLKRSEVDWSQSKVIFVSPEFTDIQRNATNFQDLNIDLWEVGQYESGMIAIDVISKQSHAPSLHQSIKSKGSLDKVTSEIKVYTEATLLESCLEETQELYQDFKQAILSLSSGIEPIARKHYISFKKDNKTLVDIECLKSQLKITINSRIGELNDARKLARDVSKVGHLGNGDYQIIVSDTEDLEYIMSLIKQAIKEKK